MAHIPLRPLPGSVIHHSVARTVGPPPTLLRLLAVLVIPLFVAPLIATGQKALENYQLAVQADQIKQRIHALRQENLALQERLVAASSDQAIEAIAREQLGLVKPGDHSLILLNGDGRPTSPVPTAPEVPVEPPVWQQWWDLFFGPVG